VAAHAAWLDCAAGDVAAAEAWARSFAANRGPETPFELATDYQQALLARVELRLGHPEAALSHTQALAAEAQTANRGWTVVQALALMALAHRGLGREAEARDALEKALNLAFPDGYIRLFLDEGEPMRQLLHVLETSLAPNNSLRDYVVRLLNAFTAVHAQLAPAAHSPTHSRLVEPLSARELEVLRLLAEGHSNRDIAATLVISVGTVKSHINHILGKLAAHSRTQAIAHARTLELV
jgi:LuxR family maltose regulon positive regulatory protein